MSDFWSFRRMVTPAVVEVVFVLGCIGTTVVAIGYFARGGSTNLLYGLSIIVFGPLAVRLACEAIVVLFAINETLTDIRGLVIWFADREYVGDEEESDDALVLAD